MILNLDKLSTKELMTGSFFLIVSIFFFTMVAISVNKRDESIENNRFYTIGKVVKFRSNRSFSNYTFMYYFNGIKYEETNDIDDGDRNDCIGKYYKIELSRKNPFFANIFLTKPVSDIKTIINAGFNIEKQSEWKLHYENKNALIKSSE